MRIDKFLKVSRILKRRTLAQDAAKEGKIFVLGKAVKPSYQVKIGDEIEIKFGSGTGALKYQYVSGKLYSILPGYVKLFISDKLLDTWIETVVDELQEYLEKKIEKEEV